MIFGDKAYFAAEIELCQAINSLPAECRFTYWINDIEVGNLDLPLYLMGIKDDIKLIMQHSYNRQSKILFNMDYREAFEKVLKSNRDFLCHNISYDMKIDYKADILKSLFDVVLIESEEDAKIIYRDRLSISSLIKRRVIPAGYFDLQLQKLMNYLEDSVSKDES